MDAQSELKNILGEVLNAIAKGETKEALDLLKEKKELYPSCEDDIIMLSNRQANLGGDSIKGIISPREIYEETNKITSAVIYHLIPKIKVHTGLSAAEEEQKPVGKGDLLSHGYFPNYTNLVPFGHLLEDLFFLGKYDHRFPIHGPNVIRFTKALFDNEKSVPGLYKADAEGHNPWDTFNKQYLLRIKDILIEGEAADTSGDLQEKEDSIRNLLIVSALYHDIGKSIKNPKHPEIGANLIRNYDENERQKLTAFLSFSNSKNVIENRQNRFALLTSIVQHHDKFGVVSTGEGAPPIFSDILYFASNRDNIPAIKKNVTAVMLLNLADIAAVNTANKNKIKNAAEIAKKIKEVRTKISSGNAAREDVQYEKEQIDNLLKICMEEKSCLGISMRKIKNVMQDWNELIDAIVETKGDRLALKEHLLHKEKNPSRTIERILRLVEESVITAEAGELINQDYLSKTTVEATFVSILGTYQFLSFCEKYATVVKLDYGLRFFQSIVCACVRKKIFPLNYAEKHHEAFEKDEENERPTKSADRLTAEEVAELKNMDANDKNRLARKITSLIIKILESVISRYSGVFDLNTHPPRRFGLEMGDLTTNNHVWRSLVEQLCLDEDKESFALSWMIDEVTFWSFD